MANTGGFRVGKTAWLTPGVLACVLRQDTEEELVRRRRALPGTMTESYKQPKAV